jgi:hypothetical protein
VRLARTKIVSKALSQRIRQVWWHMSIIPGRQREKNHYMRLAPSKKHEILSEK